MGRPAPLPKGVRRSNHGRNCDRINGWVELNSLERLQASPGRGDFASVQKEERETEPSKERSFTELRFASFPLQFCGTEGLSRVEMNALRAPLTSLSVSAEMEIFFL